MRKVVQIAIAPEGDNCLPLLVALADDGTMWLGNIPLSDPVNPEWVQVPPIPQDDPL